MKRAINYIKVIFFILFISITSPTLAEDNTCVVPIRKVTVATVGRGSETKLVLSGSVNLTIPLLTIGGQSRFESLSVSGERDDLWELTYYAGQAGTSYMVSEYRKIIIDPCQSKILGEGELRIIPQDEEDIAKWQQPHWVWGSDDLYVIVDGYRSEHIILPAEKIAGSHQFQDFKAIFDPNKQWEKFDQNWMADHHHPDTLKSAADPKTPANFGGHYRVLYFGCGTGCSGIGILDKATGDYFEPGFVVHRGFNQEERMIHYRVDSGLIILTGRLNEDGPKGVHYFSFDGKSLIPLK